MKTEYVRDHLSIKITRFFMGIIGLWRSDGPREKLISNCFLAYTFASLIIAMVVILMDLWYSWGDLAAVSYNVPCTTSTVQEFSKLVLFLYHRRKVMEFNTFTENTFWKIKYDRPDLEILENCNRNCMWAYGASFLLMQTITWYYMSIPLIENLSRNSSERELPFRIWFDLPLAETPWFEVTFTLEAIATCYVGICSTAFATFLFTINLYAAGQFRILQRKLEFCTGMLTNTDETKRVACREPRNNIACDQLKETIKQHQLLILYMERIENLYCYIMLGQALGGVLQICFSSFQIVLGAEVSVQRIGLSIVFLVGSTIQLFLFSWSCHTIIDQSSAVAEAAYRSSWCDLSGDQKGITYRKAILIMICRSQRPCVLTVGKFAPMSLNTLASVFNTSISYFAVLRQMQEEEA